MPVVLVWFEFSLKMFWVASSDQIQDLVNEGKLQHVGQDPTFFISEIDGNTDQVSEWDS